MWRRWFGHRGEGRVTEVFLAPFSGEWYDGAKKWRFWRGDLAGHEKSKNYWKILKPSCLEIPKPISFRIPGFGDSCCSNPDSFMTRTDSYVSKTFLWFKNPILRSVNIAIMAFPFSPILYSTHKARLQILFSPYEPVRLWLGPWRLPFMDPR